MVPPAEDTFLALPAPCPSENWPVGQFARLSRYSEPDPDVELRGAAVEPVQAKDASAPSRTGREDFKATSDPALQEGNRSDVKLLDYTELYSLWERQQWLTQDLDFSQDRIDWHERIPEEERFQRMYGLSSFFIGEQKVADELGPIMRAAPREDMRILLYTQ